MNRRRFLAATATATTATAGCLGITAPVDDTHPLANTTQTVRIDVAGESPHDLQANAREALTFWEEHSQEFVDFSISFEVVESDDPDMIIVYDDTATGCEDVEEYSERVLGCAPLLLPGRRVPQPIVARVVAARRPYGKIRITTKHEIGHILGLDHDADPRNIMSNRPEDRIPQYELRIAIWETILDIHERSGETTRLLNHGIESYVNGEYIAAAAAFDAAAGDYEKYQQLAASAINQLRGFDDPTVETVAREDLRGYLNRIEQRMAVAVEMSEALARASRAGQITDQDTQAAEVQIASDYITTFNDIGQVELRDIAIALGLVRGFERDTPVVDFDEDDLDEDDDLGL